MEMIPMMTMMTQPQDAAAPTTGPAATVKNPSWLQSLSTPPVLFADMLQGMLPPARPGAGTVDTMTGTMQPGRRSLPFTLAAGADAAGELPDSVTGGQEQSNDQVEGLLAQLLAMAGQLPADQSRSLPVGTDIPLQPVDGGPGQCPAVETLAVPTASGEPPPDGGSLPATAAAPEARDLIPAPPQPGPDAAEPVASSGLAALPKQTAQPARAPADTLPPSGHHRAGSGEEGKPARQTGPARCDGVQAPATTADPTRSAVNDPTDGPSFSPTPAPPTPDPARFNGSVPVATEALDAPPPHPAEDAAGNQARQMAGAVLAGRPGRAGESGGNGNRESGPREEEKERTPAVAEPATRTVPPPLSNRTSIQPKIEEPKNALRDSILAQVRESIVSHDGKGNGTITVRLNPVDLGDLQINLRIENQRVAVEVISDNRTVRDALMANLDHLKETFLKQNLDMERFDVSGGGGSGFGQGFREERGDQRRLSTLPFAEEAVPGVVARQQGEDDWGARDTSLVNLRL